MITQMQENPETPKMVSEYLPGSAGLLPIFTLCLAEGCLFPNSSNKELGMSLVFLLLSQDCSNWPEVGHMPTHLMKSRVNSIQTTSLRYRRGTFPQRKNEML